jgi:hypothetical protein
MANLITLNTFDKLQKINQIKCDVTFSPAPKNEEIEFILQEIRGYLSKDISGFFRN